MKSPVTRKFDPTGSALVYVRKIATSAARFASSTARRTRLQVHREHPKSLGGRSMIELELVDIAQCRRDAGIRQECDPVCLVEDGILGIRRPVDERASRVRPDPRGIEDIAEIHTHARRTVSISCTTRMSGVRCLHHGHEISIARPIVSGIVQSIVRHDLEGLLAVGRRQQGTTAQQATFWSSLLMRLR